jgi:mannose-1-phosphate guanylyltransferase/mannose-1-phosphate guanylyltransferase/phosphomannomutase
VTQAFILGAGLGTRLKALTESLPKPLIPVYQKPLITYAFDHLIEVGIDQFMINTHHCPDEYTTAFPDSTYRGASLAFRNEVELLETAGGIANIADWLPRDESFVVYNGDILTDMPLQPLLDAHAASGNLVTLALRSQGDALQVGFDADSGRVVDVRNYLHSGCETLYQFTGVYVVDPAFMDFLTPGKKESVVLPFLEVIKDSGRLGGAVVDGGEWSDLGTREAYLRANASLAGGDFPSYGAQTEQQRFHPTAKIHPDAFVGPVSSIGADCEVGADAKLDNSILWPGAKVAEGTSLRNCVVRSGQTATGVLVDEDI